MAYLPRARLNADEKACLDYLCALHRTTEKDLIPYLIVQTAKAALDDIKRQREELQVKLKKGIDNAQSTSTGDSAPADGSGDAPAVPDVSES
jgi:hypothetical protein